jgi:acetylornithine/succinyldiaminopimelate/putrescine aminotransferase
LLIGVEFRADAGPVVQAALERGLLVNRTSGTVLRLLPPYVVSERDVDEALATIDAAVDAAFPGGAA